MTIDVNTEKILMFGQSKTKVQSLFVFRLVDVLMTFVGRGVIRLVLQMVLDL